MTRCVTGILIAASAAAVWFSLQALAPNAGAHPDLGIEVGRVSAPASAGTESAPASPVHGPRPRLQVNETVHDFGTMAVGRSGSHVFVVRNVGDAPLEFGEPLVTCKCTLGTLASRSVPPGGSVEVTLDWKSDKASSRFREGAEIPTNDPDHRRLTLAVEGAIEPLVDVSPVLDWDLGVLDGDEPRTMTGAVYSRILESFSVRDVECSHPLFSAHVRPLDEAHRQRLDAKAGYAIGVTVDPRFQESSVASLLEIETDVAGAPRLRVQVTAERPAPIRFLAGPGVRWNGIDQAVDLGHFAAEDGATATLFLFVTDPDGERFQITSAEADPRFVKVAVVQDTGFRAPERQRFEVSISVPAGSPPGLHREENCAKVWLRTNHPTAPEIKLYVEFQSIASAR